MNSGLRSPLQQSMAEYQSTVFDAARDVETLLTQYHHSLKEVSVLEQTHESAMKALELSVQQFEFGRVKGDHVVANHSQLLKATAALAASRSELAMVAIDLFRATGGECHLEQVPTATFYHQPLGQ